MVVQVVVEVLVQEDQVLVKVTHQVLLHLKVIMVVQVKMEPKEAAVAEPAVLVEQVVHKQEIKVELVQQVQ
tara:strand:+ start:23 stop:235 length:213 start_codon:yes stop_codon:yes gene_type:complete